MGSTKTNLPPVKAETVVADHDTAVELHVHHARPVEELLSEAAARLEGGNGPKAALTYVRAALETLRVKQD